MVSLWIIYRFRLFQFFLKIVLIIKINKKKKNIAVQLISQTNISNHLSYKDHVSQSNQFQLDKIKFHRFDLSLNILFHLQIYHIMELKWLENTFTLTLAHVFVQADSQHPRALGSTTLFLLHYIKLRTPSDTQLAADENFWNLNVYRLLECFSYLKKTMNMQKNRFKHRFSMNRRPPRAPCPSQNT